MCVYLDMDECKGDTNPCDGDCKNTVGGYTCRCPSGYKGNAYVPNGCEGTQNPHTGRNTLVITSKASATLSITLLIHATRFFSLNKNYTI